MRVILHIGQSKTGTTSLQSFLASNRASLATAGILYPDVYRRGIPLNVQNHHSVAEALCGFRRFPGFSAEAYFPQFLKQAKDKECDTLLLSGESFWGAPQIWRLAEGVEFFEAHATKLKNLKQLLGKSECHVVLYLRRQDEWMDTTIPQIIHYEGLLGKTVYQSDEQVIDMLEPHLDYAAMLDMWKGIVEPSKMTVIPYERDRLVGNNTIKDFLSRTDLIRNSLDFSWKSEEEHGSLDRRYIWLKKELNKIKKQKTEERVIVSCLNKINSRLDSFQSYKIHPSLKMEILSNCEKINITLAQKFGKADQEFFNSNHLLVSSSESEQNVSSEERREAIISFCNLYFSYETSCVRFKIKVASFLRNKHPVLHALIRRVIGMSLLRKT